MGLVCVICGILVKCADARIPRVHQGARFCTARDISAHGVGFVRRRQRWQGRGFSCFPQWDTHFSN